MDWRDRLRDAINRTGKKHNYIAEQAGITSATLSRILTGRHAAPGFGVVVRVSTSATSSVSNLSASPASNERRCERLPES
jgi:transcriptional regulator with XRE-family HTH domain